MIKNKLLLIGLFTFLPAGCGKENAAKQEESIVKIQQDAPQRAFELVSKVVLDVPPDHGGEHAKQRQAAFKDMAKYWFVIRVTVDGREQFDEHTFNIYAQNFADKAPQAFNHFQKDYEDLNGSAKDEIWINAVKFKHEEDQFLAAVTKFNQKAANLKNVSAIKAEFNAVAQSCDSCHQAFKKEQLRQNP